MTQARELSCLHVRLEKAGDQKGEPPTHWKSSQLSALVFPFLRGPWRRSGTGFPQFSGRSRGWGPNPLWSICPQSSGWLWQSPISLPPSQ